MVIFLAGVSCIGKSTVGERLGRLLSFSFIDLDRRAEVYFNLPIRRIHELYSSRTFLIQMGIVLDHFLGLYNDHSVVVALPPWGLMGALWHRVREVKDRFIIHMIDTPENISERIVFMNEENQLVRKPYDKEKHRKMIIQDIAYYNRSFKRADVSVDITGLDADGATMQLFGVVNNGRIQVA
jgi:shikimate kinase